MFIREEGIPFPVPKKGGWAPRGCDAGAQPSQPEVWGAAGRESRSPPLTAPPALNQSPFIPGPHLQALSQPLKGLRAPPLW